MSACVLDASATFPWLFEDEASPAADALLDLVTEQGAVVPPLWFPECANGLAMAERRGRIDQAGVVKATGLLRQLPLEVDDAALAREEAMEQFDVTREQIAAVLEFVAQNLRESAPVDAHPV